MQDLNRSKRYAIIKYALAIIDLIYIFILVLGFLALGLSRVLVQLIYRFIPYNYLVLPVYFLAIYLIYYILDFPLNFYRSFVLEHKFSLSAQKISDWAKDQIKGSIIFYIIALILFGTFYFILKIFPDKWWLVVSAFWIFFNLILTKLVPIIIIPLFFKYKILADTILRARIINLAEKMKIKIIDVFEIDFSRKTLKANAALVGLGTTKRVILADTLKDKYNYDEIEAILAHEFAHYRFRHLLKLMLLNSLATIVIFYVIFRTNNYTLNFFGLSTLADLASFPLILLYIFVFGIIMQPFENFMSRIFERNADIVALKVTGKKEAFISMMEKLANQNLADRNPHPIIKFFFFDHPPIDERIEMAKKI